MKAQVLITILLYFVPSFLLAQEQIQKALMGNWTTVDIDSNYQFLDRVVFVQNINHLNGKNVCKTVDLEVSEINFKFKQTFHCTEPGRVTFYNSYQSIRLYGFLFFKILEIKVGQEIMKFRLISYKKRRLKEYPFEEKVMVLKKL